MMDPFRHHIRGDRNLSASRWNRLNVEITRCVQCQRLIEHCANVATVKRKSYRDQDYWGKPVPNLGAPQVSLLVVGLAPGAHGANRTGQMFTGDRSGEWLFRAMHRFGFANQPHSATRDDGLRLIDCAITNIAHCAPPDNKPSRDELSLCLPFFKRTLELCSPIVIVALGSMAWKATIPVVIECSLLARPRRKPKFAHGAVIPLTDDRWLIGSYHPSQQNTFTGRLTESMFDSVFEQARGFIQRDGRFA